MAGWDAEYYRVRYAGSKLGWGAESRRAYLYRAVTRIVRRAARRPRVLLEVGCGAGYLSKHLAHLPSVSRVIAGDLSRDAVALARSSLSGVEAVVLVRFDAQELPFRGESADVVAALDVVEHLPDPDRFLVEAGRVLRCGGVVLLSTPNPGSLGARIKGSYPEWRGRPVEERCWQWFGYRDDTHISIRPMDQWREALRAAGYVVERDGTDFWWDAPYVRWLPVLPQEILFKGVHRMLTVLFGFLPWAQGENYVAVARKRGGSGGTDTPLTQQRVRA